MTVAARWARLRNPGRDTAHPDMGGVNGSLQIECSVAGHGSVEKRNRYNYNGG